MALAVSARGSGDVRPLVVVYHGGSADQVSARATVIHIFGKDPSFYRTPSRQNPTLNDIIAQTAPRVDAVAFFPIVLVGFSAGCQGVRRQLLARQYPTATICADGIHASIPPARSQIEPWRIWFEKCGADLASGPGSGSPSADLPIARVSLTQIPTAPRYLSARDTMEEITGWELAPGPAQEAPRLYESGNLEVTSFPGKGTQAHIHQGSVVLPKMLGDVARELGFGGAPGEERPSPPLATQPPLDGERDPQGAAEGSPFALGVVLSLLGAAAAWIWKRRA